MKSRKIDVLLAKENMSMFYCDDIWILVLCTVKTITLIKINMYFNLQSARS